MPFKPGQKKPAGSGKKKGHITRDRQMLLDKAKELGVDPFEILLRFAANDWKGLGYESHMRVVGKTQRGDDILTDTIEPQLRARCASDACQFMLPKLKAIEVDDKSAHQAAIVYVAEWGNRSEPSDTSDEDA